MEGNERGYCLFFMFYYNYVTFSVRLFIHPSVAHHSSGTVHHVIIFGTRVK